MEDYPFQINLTDVDHLDPDTDRDFLKEVGKQFRRSGVLWLQGVFKREWMQTLNEAYSQKYAPLNSHDHPDVCMDVGRGDRNLYTIILEPPFDHPDLYDSPKLFPILRAILFEQILIQSFGIVSSRPGSQRQSLHMDHDELFKEMHGLSRMLPSYALTVAIPLIDFNNQTGTTAIWPGSHMQTDGVPEEDDDVTFEKAVLPAAAAGDCVIWDFRTWHCGMPNLTDKERPLLYQSVTRPWFEDRCNYNTASGRHPLLATQDFLDGLDQRHASLFSGAKVSESIERITAKSSARVRPKA